jgi:thymidine kinase
MKKMGLIFYYGVMGSGKTTQLLKQKNEAEKTGLSCLILQPDFHSRDGRGVVKSRKGEEAVAVVVTDNLYVTKIKDIDAVDIIFIDEANFLNIKQIEDLKELSENKLVYCYGVKIDFRGQLFEASKRLLELSDEFIEIESPCDCGKKAEINAKIIAGKITVEGDNQSGDLGLYKPMCYHCFLEGLKKN